MKGRSSFEWQTNLSQAEKKTRGRQILAWLLPRPRDFVGKGYYFWLGFAAALVLVGVQESQVALLKHFFTGLPPASTHAVPAYAILTLGFAYFLAEEFLLQQSKLIFDDILDQFRDQAFPLNKNRALSSGMITKNQAVWMVLIRWGLALLLGWLLGGGLLLSIFVFISVLQMIYEWVAKPLAQRFPWLPLICISPNMALRFLVGYMAVAGSNIVSLPLFLILIALIAYYFGFMADFWKMEAVYNAQKGLGQKRPQSAYYLNLEHSLPIQRIGLLASILTAFGLWVLYGLYDLTRLSRVPFVASMQRLHDQAPLAFDLIVCLIWTSLVYLASRLILSLVQKSPVKAYFRSLFIWAKTNFMAPAVMLSTAIFILSLVFENAWLYLLSFFIFTLGNLLIYEGMRYEQYIAAELYRQMPYVMQCWKYYFSSPTRGISLRKLWAFSSAVLMNKTIIPNRMSINDVEGIFNLIQFDERFR